jgi:hypothetical protein
VCDYFAMSSTPTVTREFFDQYARNRSALDIGLITSQYADSFMVADPKGARVAEKPAVVAAFPRGKEFLRGLGYQSTKVVSLDETRLDEHYVLARVRFVWRFEKTPAKPIDVEVDSTFILHVDHDALTIVFQQEREDFQEALRARGVLPAKP